MFCSIMVSFSWFWVNPLENLYIVLGSTLNIYNYSRTSVDRTRRDCQNMFKLSEVRATEVL